MSAQVILYLGPARSGETREMLREYRAALRQSSRTAPGLSSSAPAINHTLWLAPTSRTAAAIRHQLVTDGLDACLAPGIITFDQLTNIILSTGEAASAAGINASTARELLRRAIQSVVDRNQLHHFRDAARRSGFVDLLARHIRELKQHGLDPPAYAKAAAPHDREAEHRELAHLYAEYQHQLNSHKLLDAEGRHIAAVALLAAGKIPRLNHLELIIVDGFTDFTRTQHEQLRLLARHTAKLFVTLPNDDGRTDHFSQHLSPVVRPDLFAKTAATLAELKHFHPKLEIRELPSRPLPWPALDHLTQHIFRNPRQVPPLPDAATASLNQLEILESAGPHDEIIQIARHIKQRLASNSARPSDVVVTFRSLAEAAPRIREVFTEFGIPHSLETGLPLATDATLRTLLSLLRLDDEDWPFRRVVSVLTNNTLAAIAADARCAADWLVRDLQIAKGRDGLLKRVEQLAAVDATAGELSDQAKHRHAQAKLALPALQSLAAALDALPEKATPIEWIAALENLGAQLGFMPLADHTAWQTITTNFAALDRLDKATGESPRPLTRSGLLHWLVDLARHESLPRQFDDAGRVRVLSAATARTISARHLYLAGMTEQAFPSAERAGQLATDADYRFLAGVADQNFAAACPPAVGRPQGEMLLFYEVLTRAEESLTISYPALDDKAQQLPPSPYVTEIRRTLGDAFTMVKRMAPHLSPIPTANERPSSVTDWRIQAIAEAIGKDRDLRLLAGNFQSTHPNSEPGRPRLRIETPKALAAALEAGLRITHARQRREDFGPAEGLLVSPAAAARLAERFGPKHLWSPSQWEKYAACPYQFFAQQVLQLEPLGELVLETDHRRRGSLLHDVLATFHRQFGAAPAETWNALRRDGDKFVTEMRRTLQSAVDAMPRAGIDATLLELDRRQIEKWSGGYLAQHEKYDAAWSEFDEPPRPAHFELRFGPRRPGDDSPEDPRSTDKVFGLDIGGETIHITGRIDRIDVGRAGDHTVFNVIDYKSGRRPSFSAEKLESGERLQPAVYVMAAEVLVFGSNKATPLWAGYWSMQNGASTDARYSLQCSVDGHKPDEKWEQLRHKVVKRIAQFVTDIRHGNFPVASRDPDCTSRCEFNTICRIAQIRSLEKTWISELEIPQPPAPSP